MSIYLGNTGTRPISIHKGSQAITAVYVGENKVWSTTNITEVDYIETDGSCYINIGAHLTVTSIVVSSFYTPSSTAYQYFYGTLNNEQVSFYLSGDGLVNSHCPKGGSATGINRTYVRGVSDSKPYYLLKQDFTKAAMYTAYFVNLNSPYAILSRYLYQYQSLDPYNRLSSGKTNSLTFDPAQELGIFAGTETGGVPMQATSRFYGMKIWNDGVLAFDGVPAYDGSAYGIYDKVGGVFYANSGTGTMTGGNL